MDDAQLDKLSRAVASRRTVMGGLAAVAAAVAPALLPEALAKKKKKKKKKKACASGATRCGDACVNLQTDAQHCGSCNSRCGNGVACVDGKCPSSCPASQIRCVDLCVDPTSNENHCGGCGRKCKGDETCLGGVCGCADGTTTSCPNNLCVDLQTDDEHCGTCGNACADNEACRNGACVASPCAGNQIDCGGGRCIPAVANACCEPADCGPYDTFNHITCQNNVCACKVAGEGICKRYPEDGSGQCHRCCPGGAGCRFDEVCLEFTTPSGTVHLCDCPTGWQRCNYNPHPTGTCVEHPETDSTKCGPYCTVCDEYDKGSICCGSQCVRGCGLNTPCPQETPCGPHCNPCNSDSICCNQGAGTAPRCIPKQNGSNVCYMNL
ncbi:MAG: hypothetical protein QM692_10955 [Thermomicrobiales bacterium]